jgi:hypothetical protein
MKSASIEASFSDHSGPSVGIGITSGTVINEMKGFLHL